MHVNYRLLGLKRLDVYIISKFLGTYFFSIVLILSIGIVFDLTEKLDDFYEHNAPWREIVFDYYLNFIPYYMNLFSSLFTFLAVIYFTSKMAGNSEIIAILAGGISFRRLMVPYFISATVIFIISFGLGGYVIPNSTRQMLEFENKYVRNYKKENVRNVQMEVEDGVILYIDRYEMRNNKGYRFSLEKFDGKHLTSRLTAETISWDSAFNWKINKYLKRDFEGMRDDQSGVEVVSGKTKKTGSRQHTGVRGRVLPQVFFAIGGIYHDFDGCVAVIAQGSWRHGAEFGNRNCIECLVHSVLDHVHVFFR